ncbi:serine hydrolase domain-containing protein [Paraliomyxa miuraensis]|uniref:serine hydrolase domain-containing protein n=1 Tax=Paraliomyxa miuraensis TaxID=376150 RepID=UPI0022545D03|nr:serine hydrolase domain-containing protein [Paraliomyxa miuraensis]MCX4239597.1 beta-lactamase family protein [Paraliomyxa miuraensis]
MAQDVAPLPVFPNPDRRERLLDSVPTLTRRIEAFMAADHIPGLAVGLVIDDELAWAQGFGVTDLQTGRPVTPQTAFRIGSVTKTITMTAILRLRDEGKLDLDHPVVEYLPEVGAIGHPTDELQGFTVRQVLTHSSGLPRNGRFDFEGPEHRVDRAEVEASLEGLDLQTVPGLVSSYSNLGYMLLGLLIEDVTGQGYREHIDQAVLAPLGMKASVWSAGDVRTELAMPHDVENGKPKPMHHEDHGAASAGGGLYSTVEDMARFAALQLGAWPPRSGDDSGPLRRSSIREAHSIHFAPHATTRFTPGRYPAAELAGTGLAWSVTRDCELGHVVGHNGRNTGYTGTLALLPQRGVGLVLLSNQHSTNLAELNVHLLEDLAENPALTVRELPVDPRLEPRSRELFAAVVAGDESRLGALLASSWSPEQLQKLWARWRGIHERVGACELDRLGEVTATHATVHGTCERGRVRMELEAHGSGFVDVVPMVALDRPPKHLRKAAANVGKLLARWDEDLAARTFLQRGRPSRYRDFLHGIGQTRGRCTVGRVVEASDVHVEHRLDCEHRSGRLVLTSGEGSTVVDGLWIRDDPEDPRRCVDL